MLIERHRFILAIVAIAALLPTCPAWGGEVTFDDVRFSGEAWSLEQLQAMVLDLRNRVAALEANQSVGAAGRAPAENHYSEVIRLISEVYSPPKYFRKEIPPTVSARELAALERGIEPLKKKRLGPIPTATIDDVRYVLVDVFGARILKRHVDAFGHTKTIDWRPLE